MLDSVIRGNKKYYPPTLLEECKYPSSSDKSDNESDNEFDNEFDNDKV